MLAEATVAVTFAKFDARLALRRIVEREVAARRLRVVAGPPQRLAGLLGFVAAG